MNEQDNLQASWAENIIIADADHLDRVAFDLTVNFERMLNRRIPQADLARWIDCIALDGGVREGDNHTHVIFIHSKEKTAFDNFAPNHFENNIHGQAFRDNLGEFTLSAIPIETGVGGERLLFDTMSLVCQQKEVKRVMVVADEDKEWDDLRRLLREIDDEKRITLFSMRPMPGGNFRQEILGYSLMSALGIRGEELGGMK
ncbi:MAG: hypothetical protein IKX22_04365 [Prevotella sp.]|nr:hypothetical protein [Prevotella sp.]